MCRAKRCHNGVQKRLHMWLIIMFQCIESNIFIHFSGAGTEIHLLWHHRRAHQRLYVGGYVACENIAVESPLLRFVVMDLRAVAAFEHRHNTALTANPRNRCSPMAKIRCPRRRNRQRRISSCIKPANERKARSVPRIDVVSQAKSDSSRSSPLGRVSSTSLTLP